MSSVSIVDNSQASGCLPRTTKPGEVFRIYEDLYADDIIPRSEWRDLIEMSDGSQEFVVRIKNQGSEGSCTSNATTGAWEIKQNEMTRRPLVLSAISLYKRVGRSPSSGSTVDGNVREITERGALLADSYEASTQLAKAKGLATFPERGFYTPWPSQWETNAEPFRAFEWTDVETIEGMFSALLRGLPCVYGRAGHAICGVRLVYRDGKFACKYANSWGDWGDDGFGYDTESYIARAINTYGCFALRQVVMNDVIDPATS